MRAPALLLAAAVLLAASQGAAAGRWASLPDMPLELGEVAAGLVHNKKGTPILVVVGEGNPATLLYNTATRRWSQGEQRPHVGHHIGAEVINNRLYLFGGLRQGGNKVQIYDVDKDEWTAGRDLPYEVGSAATAHIGGQVFLCGGILYRTDDTTDRCIRYDVASNTWHTDVAAMPLGVNHAAAGTDGKLMFVAGGRPGRNSVSAGFADLQIYDPKTNRWSRGPALPEGRGGTGKAVVHAGQLLVMGGETTKRGPQRKLGLTAARVYARVDRYDIKARKWHEEAPMTVARHGIFPVSDRNGNIYVAGGGVKAGASQSGVNTVYHM